MVHVWIYSKHLLPCKFWYWCCAVGLGGCSRQAVKRRFTTHEHLVLHNRTDGGKDLLAINPADTTVIYTSLLHYRSMPQLAPYSSLVVPCCGFFPLAIYTILTTSILQNVELPEAEAEKWLLEVTETLFDRMEHWRALPILDSLAQGLIPCTTSSTFFQTLLTNFNHVDNGYCTITTRFSYLEDTIWCSWHTE